MTRGDIYWVDLTPRSGSEQSRRRPAILISSDGFNQTPNWRSLIIIPLTTSRRQSVRGHTVVVIPAAAAGLPEDSVALAHQITTLDRAKFGGKVGTLPPDYLRQVENAIRAAIDL